MSFADKSGVSFKAFTAQIILVINDVIVPILFAAAFLAFTWGIVQYYFIQQEEHREEARRFTLWGLLGMVLLFSLWGVVNIVLDTFGLRG